jgi:3-dehydrosphinganine reductase
LGSQQAALDALEAACEPHGGQTPDAIFLCAGKATPGFFIEQTEESLRKCMDETYWVGAFSAMVRDQVEFPLWG